MTTLLVTGASGFVGTRLIQRLTDTGVHVRALVRRPGSAPEGNHVTEVVVDDLMTVHHWHPIVEGCHQVIHLAAHVHVMSGAPVLEDYRRVNTHATQALAAAAAETGVQRFVFASSIKVCGEERDTAYVETDTPDPSSPYGISKRDAEVMLQALHERTSLEVAIVRPPLVYGPGVRANFRMLMRWVHTLPVWPFGRAEARRSMVFVDNLVDALDHCRTHPGAAGEIFHVSDGHDLSTTELFVALARALGRRAYSLPLSGEWALRVARYARRDAALRRLLQPLQVDASKLTYRTQWSPPVTVSQGLAETAAWYLQCRL